MFFSLTALRKRITAIKLKASSKISKTNSGTCFVRSERIEKLLFLVPSCLTCSVVVFFSSASGSAPGKDNISTLLPNCLKPLTTPRI